MGTAAAKGKSASARSSRYPENRLRGLRPSRTRRVRTTGLPTCGPRWGNRFSYDGAASDQRYPGQYRDEESGLNQNYFRDYDPKTGRYIQADPIGVLLNDVYTRMTALNHLYAYAGENPVNFVDPLGLHTVGFSGTGVLVVDDNGNPVAYYPATSGLPGYMDPMYQNLPDKGPIPAGRYYFNPNEMSRVEGFRQRLRDFFGLLDWGNVRVPLYPYPDTNTLRRRGFKIHGGKKPGSKGCIDIGQKDTDFYDLLHGHQGPIDVIVDYR